jgi:hypothetical protein
MTENATKAAPSRQRPSQKEKFAAFTRNQIAGLEIRPGRPLIVSDADEVLVRFADPLRSFLESRDLYFELKDYRLVGNVRRRHNNQPIEQVELFGLIDDFFAETVDNMPIVDGAINALTTLSTRADVVILTNVPDTYRDRRAEAFRKAGLDFPVIANTGLKGAPVRALQERAQGPIIFVDDIDKHITSVAESVPDSYRVHFVADEQLAAVCERAEHSHHRSDCWQQTSDAIGTFLAAAGY